MPAHLLRLGAAPNSRHTPRRLRVEPLEARQLLAADPILTEIMAENDTALADGSEPPDFPDWIELYNAGDQPADLAGWHLTDDAQDLDRWTFPAETLEAGEFLTVFASGNDGPDAAGNLHTNFALGAGGEFVALVRPDLTVASQLAPAFPEQHADLSFGLPMQRLVVGFEEGRSATVGHWQLDETVNPSGNTVAVDTSGHGLDGVYQPRSGGSGGPVVGVPGAPALESTAADFDGVADEIFLGSPDALKMENDFTITAWVNPDDTQGVQRIFSQYPTSSPNNVGYGFGLNGSQLRFTTWGILDYNTTLVSIAPNTWTHVAVAFDADNDATFFVNGRLAQSLEGAAPARLGDNNFFIGSHGAAGEPFDGTIDDVRVISGTLTEEEIRAVAQVDELPDTLLGWWKLDEVADPSSATAVVDHSGNGLVGTYQPLGGTGGPVLGQVGAGLETGTAADFNGAGDEIYLASPAALKMTNDFTVAAWIKPDDLDGVQRIFSQYPVSSPTNIGYGFGINGSGFRFTTYGVKDYNTAGGMIAADRWSHVAVTFDTNNDASFFVNGVLKQTVTGVDPARTGNNNFFIGSTGVGERFDGAIDEVQIHSGVLSQAEIQELAGTFLVGHWPLDETVNPSGNTVAAFSSDHGFDGIYQPRSGGSGGPVVGVAGALPSTGTAADFDGVIDEIYLGHPAELAALTNDLTVMAWINPDDVSDADLTQRIYSGDSIDATGWGFGIRGDELKFTTYGVKDYFTGAAAGTSGIEADIPTDRYTHVAAVMDASNGVTFYVDGVRAGSTIAGPAPANPIGTRNWFIGRTGRTEPYAGALDEVRVYRGALSGQQIQDIAQIPPAAPAPLPDGPPAEESAVARVRYVVPADGSFGASWTEAGFDDSTWAEGDNGVGFEAVPGDFAGIIQSPVPVGSDSLYARFPFTLPDAALPDLLTLRMMYDDGFVAYVNGAEVARRNAPAAPAWDSTATAERPNEEAAVYENINLAVAPGLLMPGDNVLAIHGLNFGDDDALLLAELIGIDRGASWRFFAEPTPDAFNATVGVIDLVADTQFSVDRGFFDSPFDLEITTATEDATIVYTTDGSEPAVDGVSGAIVSGVEYTGPISIGSTTTLRAAAFKPEHQPTNVDTHTYVFLADVVGQSPSGETPPGWPAGSINGQVFDYGMDPEIVAEPSQYASEIDGALRAIPSLSIVTDLENLFDPATGIYVNAGQDGRLWERPASLELIHPDGSTGFQVESGIRMRGGFSRGGFNPKHSFRLFFRGEYGDTKLRFPLFEDEGVGQFDKIDLRTAQNYAWSNDTFNDATKNTFVREVFARDLQGEMDQPYTRSRYYHLYLNGQYWGLYETQERPESAYAESYFGGAREDYDVIKRTVAVDGNTVAWHALWQIAADGFDTDQAYYAVQGKNPDGSDNLQLEVHVDVDNLIDYMNVVFFTGSFDGPVTQFANNQSANNFYAIRDRNGGSGWAFFVHDFEHAMIDVNEDRTGPFPAGDQVGQFNPQWLHQQLMAHPDYRMRFADRAHQYYFNGGLLTPEGSTDLFGARAETIQNAIIGESARWGDQHEATPYTQASWQAAIDEVLGGYLSNRPGIVLDQLKAARRDDGGVLVSAPLYPSVDAPAFNQNGGVIAPGFLLEMTGDWSGAGSVEILYTTDGIDPRANGGAVAAGAIAYSDPVAVPTGRPVQARALVDGQWSALSTALFLINPATAENLAVSEIMYNPAGPAIVGAEAAFDNNDDFEFIELVNTSATDTIDLTGVRFVDGVDFAFTPESAISSLAPGGRVLVVRNAAAMIARYGAEIESVIAGQFDGGLKNGGETIRIEDAGAALVAELAYKDGPKWPQQADGGGSSLEAIALGTDLSEWESWHDSVESGGSPGVAATAAAVSRDVYYAGSSFDTPGFADDGTPISAAQAAVAADKIALLPGRAAAPENVTHYSGGINGVIVDLAHVPEAGLVTLADLALAIGNDDAPATWADAAPATFDVQLGGGRGGSDRIVLTWDENAPKNTWLEVTVLANDNTRLVHDDVFYFGNAVGDVTGPSAIGAGLSTRLLVNAADVIAVRDNPRSEANPASIDNPFDVNRDKRVDALDAILARDHATGPLASLRLITPVV